MRSKETRAASPRRTHGFTPREKEILQLIWEGSKNSEIAERLQISIPTVEAHRAMMMKKLRAKNIAALLKSAIIANMIQVN